MLDTRWQRPPFDIVRAAHVELVVSDLAVSRAFYVDLLGFVPTQEAGDALYLRGYEEAAHHSLVLRQGPRPMVGHLAYRVGDAGDLERLADFYRERGCTPHMLAAGAEAGQGPALRVQDPLGFPLEFFFAMDPAERLLQRFDLYRGAHIMRLDHFNCHVSDVAAAYALYTDLGFRCSEYTATDPPEDRLWAAWMHRKPNVHDTALMNGFGPRLHHVGFWVADTQSVLRACDIVAAAGRSDVIERGPGRHGLSNAFFVYLRDPDGHRVELYTADYYTGDPDNVPIRWSINDPRRGTFWGHWAPRSWFEESSAVAVLQDGGLPSAGGETVDLKPPLLAHKPDTVT